MRQRGIDHGLPFVWHFGMWGDVFIVSGLAAYVIDRYSHDWRVRWILLSLALGFISAALFSWTYTFSVMPEAHVQDHCLTAAGVGHLFYMAITLSVFIQFFFFTEHISAQLLRTVSVLLFVHVFLGTHMVLGILNAVFSLDWYPAQPLKSVFGWMTVAALALGLIWRNFGIVTTFNRAFVHIKNAVIRLYNKFKYWTVRDDTSTEGFLRFLDYVCSWLGPSYFFGVIAYRLTQSRYLTNGHWISFISNEGLPLFLVGLFWLIYFFSRHSARRELAIVRTLFPLGRVPDDLGDLKNRLVMGLSVLAFLGLYAALAAYVDNIKAVSFVMFAIACNDFRTRYLINKHMNRYFSDNKYAPLTSDKDYEVIKERRAVARDYLFKLPNLWKEAGRVAGCGIAFGVAIVGYLKSTDWPITLAYVLLIGTLILNEIITVRWRLDRDNRLEAIDEKRKTASST